MIHNEITKWILFDIISSNAIDEHFKLENKKSEEDKSPKGVLTSYNFESED